MNLPNFPCDSSILYLGVGGGYDVFGAIPIYESIKDRYAHQAVFANVDKNILTMGERHAPFYPLEFAGARKLTGDLQRIIDTHNVDTIIAVDGGVDCLMHGDEQDAGTAGLCDAGCIEQPTRDRHHSGVRGPGM